MRSDLQPSESSADFDTYSARKAQDWGHLAAMMAVREIE
jgi:hypothetical protein